MADHYSCMYVCGSQECQRPLGSELVVTVSTLIKCMPDTEGSGCNKTCEPCLEEWADSGHVEMGTGLVLLNKDYKIMSVP